MLRSPCHIHSSPASPFIFYQNALESGRFPFYQLPTVLELRSDECVMMNSGSGAELWMSDTLDHTLEKDLGLGSIDFDAWGAVYLPPLTAP
jgi:hypothetical protein